MPDTRHPPMPPAPPSPGGPNFAIPRWPSSRFAFLPLSEEATISTRGQKLPNIIRNQSSASIRDMRQGSIGGSRRQPVRASNEDLVLSRTRTRDMMDRQQGRSSVDDLVLSRSRTRDVIEEIPSPPADFPIARGVKSVVWELPDDLDRTESRGAADILLTPQMRSQRLIGNSNPRYQWERYWKTDEELKKMKKPLRKYYERNNFLIQQYLYIDRLLDSSLPHNLIKEYGVDIPSTINEESSTSTPSSESSSSKVYQPLSNNNGPKVNRTKALFKLPDEETPLITRDGLEEVTSHPSVPMFEPEDDSSSGDRVVNIAIYLNFLANAILLVLKIIVTVLTSSLSVLASLVDAALDFLSTFIVWTTSRLVSTGNIDLEKYPVGRRRLEPIGVLVFSVIMITSFFQVGLEALNRLRGPDREIVALTIPAIAIMASTVIIKFACWLWCRLIRNSSVQALAQDAMTDVVFNIFSIIFPLVGYYARIWWLDPLGGLLLSLYVIVNWSVTTRTHILNLTGRACGADERNVLLYLTMRFAHTIKHIQGLAAYHAGDKLNVEVDIVLDSTMSLRDSHDLGESLQYVLESVPGVERAFVHADYKRENLPSHMQQQ